MRGVTETSQGAVGAQRRAPSQPGGPGKLLEGVTPAVQLSRREREPKGSVGSEGPYRTREHRGRGRSRGAGGEAAGRGRPLWT